MWNNKGIEIVDGMLVEGAVFVTKDGRAMYSPNEKTTIPLMKRVQGIWKLKYPEYYEESGS